MSVCVHVARFPVSICQPELFTILNYTPLSLLFIISFRLRIKDFFFFMILFNASLFLLTKTYTPLGGFHSSQRRSPFQHWAASQPMYIALSKRVLIEYYIAEVNGYKSKVIFKYTNYRTSRVSKTHIYQTQWHNKTYKRSKVHFWNQILRLKSTWSKSK